MWRRGTEVTGCGDGGLKSQDLTGGGGGSEVTGCGDGGLKSQDMAEGTEVNRMWIGD